MMELTATRLQALVKARAKFIASTDCGIPNNPHNALPFALYALQKLSGPLRREAYLDLLRITAELDALTGGLYREALAEAEGQLEEEDR